MSTSQKHQNFISEAVGNKAVTELAGIGEVLGSRLTAKGYDTAKTVIGQYLLLHEEQDVFVDWLKEVSGANAKQANDCHGCVKAWVESYMN